MLRIIKIIFLILYHNPQKNCVRYKDLGCGSLGTIYCNFSGCKTKIDYENWKNGDQECQLCGAQTKAGYYTCFGCLNSIL